MCAGQLLQVLYSYSTQNVPQNIVVLVWYCAILVLPQNLPTQRRKSSRKDQGFLHMVKLKSAECVGSH